MEADHRSFHDHQFGKYNKQEDNQQGCVFQDDERGTVFDRSTGSARCIPMSATAASTSSLSTSAPRGKSATTTRINDVSTTLSTQHICLEKDERSMARKPDISDSCVQLVR